MARMILILGLAMGYWLMDLKIDRSAYVGSQDVQVMDGSDPFPDFRGQVMDGSDPFPDFATGR